MKANNTNHKIIPLKAAEIRFSFKARWADMDFNGHMKNTAYLDYAADSRMLYFKQNGFSLSEFATQGIGPVIFKDTIAYFHELYMYEEFEVALRLKGLSRDGARFNLVNEIQRPDGSSVAIITSEACWLDLNTRKITPPPERLFQLMKQMEKTDDYCEIPTKSRL